MQKYPVISGSALNSLALKSKLVQLVHIYSCRKALRLAPIDILETTGGRQSEQLLSIIFQLQHFNYLLTLLTVNQESKKVCLIQSQSVNNILQKIMRMVYTYEEKKTIRWKSLKLHAIDFIYTVQQVERVRFYHLLYH